MTQRPDENESDTTSIRTPTPALSYFQSRQIEKVVDYTGPAVPQDEETFDQFEERMEQNFYNAKVALRDG